MGAANCCKKPDEIVIEEVKYSTTDNNKFTAIDQDSYPQDTEQYRSNVNAEDDNAQNQAVSNQNIYEQEGGSPKIGGAYEVPINVSSPQQNYEEGYESNNMGSPQQYESQNIHSQNIESSNLNQYEQEERAGNQYAENANVNQNLNSPKSRDENAYAGNQEEEGVDYNDLVNQMGNEANLKALRMGNAGLKTTSNSVSYSMKQSKQPLNNLNRQQINNKNIGGIDLNALAQKGAIDLKNFTLGNQQGGNIATQNVRKVEYNKIGPTEQQKTTITTTTINRQADMNNYGLRQEVTDSQNDENENLNKYFQQATSKLVSVNSQLTGSENKENFNQKGNNNASAVDLKQLALSANAQLPGGLNINTVYSQGPSPQQKTVQKVQKVSKIASVTPISSNEDISKYFNQPNKISSSQSQLNTNVNLNQLGATANAPISPQEDLNKYFRQGISQNVRSIIGEKRENNLAPEGVDNGNQIKITKINLDMEDLPETFGSSNIANYKQTVTTTKTTGKIGSDINKQVETKIASNQPENFDFQKLNIDMKNFKLDMKDLPEVFGSSDINNFKQTTTTTVTTTKKEGVKDQKDIPQDQSLNENNFKQITTTTTTEGIINMKDLPEVFGSFNISNFKPAKVTSTTTTTTKEGEIKKGQLPQDNDFKQTTTTTTTQGIIDMKDLPQVFGSTDIEHYKETKTTTTTKTEKPQIDLKGFGIEQNPSALEGLVSKDSKEIKHAQKESESGPIDLKQFGIEQNPSATPITENEDFSKYFQQTQNTSEPIDLKQFGLEDNPSAMSNFQQTTTTKTTKIETTNNGNVPIDLKQFGIEQNPSATPITENEDLNKYFKQSQNTSEPIDLKQFGLEENPSAMSNFQQTTITKTTKTETTKVGNDPIDLKQYGIDLNNANFNQTSTTTKTETNVPIDLKQFGIEQNSSSSPRDENEDYSKYFQTTQTTTTKINGPIDLNQFGIDINSGGSTGGIDLKSLGIDGGQQKTETITTVTKAGNIGNEESSGGINLSSFGHANGQQTTTTTIKTTTTGNVDLGNFGISSSSGGFSTNYGTSNISDNNVKSYGATQNYESNYNTSGTSKTTTTKVTKSFAGPTQSYSYNYSYNMPTTGSTTVTKTTYSEVVEK